MTATDPTSVTGEAGNAVLRNQNEQDILTAFVASVAMTVAPGGDDPETYVNPAYREAM